MLEHRGHGMMVISTAQDKSNYSSQAHTTVMQGYTVYYVNMYSLVVMIGFFIIKIAILWNNMQKIIQYYECIVKKDVKPIL